MGKIKREVPGELKDFAQTFDALSYRHSDYGSVFNDFVSYWTAGLLVHGDKDLAADLERKYGKDYHYFNQLIIEMLRAYDKNIVCDNSWYDGLGLFYEVIASRYKSSALGQFFTPVHLIDMMNRMLNPVQGDRVLDCCSGSGRMLLAAKSINPRIWTFAADVDPVCAKMSAINMALHGCRGEASCMNSLSMDWNFGYVINPYFQFHGTPPVAHLMKVVHFNESEFYVTPGLQEEVPEPKMKVGQLTLF
jgi:type I restriction enzyme M protein